MVGTVGLEPTWREPTDFKSVEYTNFSTSPKCSNLFTTITLTILKSKVKIPILVYELTSTVGQVKENNVKSSTRWKHNLTNDISWNFLDFTYGFPKIHCELGFNGIYCFFVWRWYSGYVGPYGKSYLDISHWYISVL